MAQSSLKRIPNGPTGLANRKERLLVPGWFLTGGTAPKTKITPANEFAPYASATSLSVAGGGVASVTNGIWYNNPTSYTYQWYRAGAAIAGATAATHTLVAGDVGFYVNCVVTAVNSFGSMGSQSNNVGPIVA
jgi:hypothetical protein